MCEYCSRSKAIEFVPVKGQGPLGTQNTKKTSRVNHLGRCKISRQWIAYKDDVSSTTHNVQKAAVMRRKAVCQPQENLAGRKQTNRAANANMYKENDVEH